ncbi:hypothetical protein HDK77DRAFT_473794 [Phyllosticta capitalensis]
MASPQVSAEGQVALNPAKTGSYTIKLSDRIANPHASSAKYKTVKYNHKPRQTAPRRTTRIKPVGENVTLAIEDRDEQGNRSRYEYKGQRKELKKTYVLVLDPNSNSCTLERLDDAYAFNLTSTPLESDSEKLKQQYPHIKLREEREDATEESLEDDGLFDEASETQSIAGSSAGASDFEEPEENNPYDFRRFLDQVQQVDTNGFASPNSQAGTPLRVPPTNTTRTTPLLSAQQPKVTKPLPKAAAPKANKAVAPSKSKTTTKKPATTSPKKAKPKDTPSIRLERVASIAAPAPAAIPSTTDSSRTSRSPAPSDDESDDEGGLQIDFGDGGPPTRGRARPSAFAFENVGDGPISLRSAADSASPSSRLHTPSFRGSKEMPDVIDFGGEDNDEQEEDVEETRHFGHDNDASGEEDHDASGDEDADADGSIDGDVEPMNLGSPAQQPAPTQPGSSVPLASSVVDDEEDAVDSGEAAGAGADEDGAFEDEFEAEMEQALASAAEQEESEESEEE